MDRKKIAKIVKETREEHQLSQSEFAFAISALLPKKVSKQDVSKWENGHTIPNFWLIFAMCYCSTNNPWVNDMAKEIIDAMDE